MSRFFIRTMAGVTCLLFLISCDPKEQTLTGKQLIDASIEAHGGKRFFDSTVQFRYEERDYTVAWKNRSPRFKAVRVLDTITYVGTYEGGLQRYYENDSLIEENMHIRRFIDSKLEGLCYLFSIPYVFDQNAVIAERGEDVVIKRKNYHTVHISFTETEDGPGDEFYLYINAETFLVDYYADKYSLTGGRMLFKRAVNQRTVDGFVFSDFYMFEDRSGQVALKDFYKGFNDLTLNDLNKLEFEDIRIVPSE